MSNSSSPKQQPRLAPAWGNRSTGTFEGSNNSGGRFQAISPSLKSVNSNNSNTNSRSNSFSLLSEDDIIGAEQHNNHGSGSAVNVARHGSGGWSLSSGRKGRSLADLAASKGGGSDAVKRGDVDGWIETGHSHGHGNAAVSEKKIIRYTRERLLSMRKQPSNEEESVLPECLKHLIGLPLLVETAQDPVCFDSFDPDEIWATVKMGRGSGSSQAHKVASSNSAKSSSDIGGHGHGQSNGSSSTQSANTWRRGVALPPASEARKGVTSSNTTSKRGGTYNRDVDDANELWDDPLETSGTFGGSSNGPSMDFSAFGKSLDEVEDRGGQGPKDKSESAFDLSHMAEATRKFEEDFLHSSNDPKLTDNDVGGKLTSSHKFGGAGLTIQSGSGDNVNVFEDFADPAYEPEKESVVDSGVGEFSSKNEDPVLLDDDKVDDKKGIIIGNHLHSEDKGDASSRLMQMIGVTSEEESKNNAPNIATIPSSSPWGTSTDPTAGNLIGSNLNVPTSNPWGNSIGITTPATNIQQEEEEKKKALLIARQKKEEEEKHARELELQEQRRRAAQQQPSASQLEIILMERISTILEKSWGGRADLHTILTTLHREDHRVINLLQSTDVLRSLLMRHPHRVSMIRQENIVIAVLVMTNAQFMQQQQQESQQKLMEEQLLQQQQKVAQAKAHADALERQKQLEVEQQQIVVTDAPWYYRDPSGNVQGPFGGKEMQQWLQAGYFNGDLPISQASNGQGPFRSLSTIFPEPKLAFQPSSSNSAPNIVSSSEGRQNGVIGSVDIEQKIRQQKQAEEEAKVAVEKAALLASQKEMEARRIAMEREENIKKEEMAANAEKEKKERQAAEEAQKQKTSQAKPQAAVDETSSAQLKMLLGMGGSETTTTTNQQTHSTKQVPSSAQATTTAAPTSAWGGVANQQGKKTSVRSMSEIQREESRVAEQMARERKARGAPSSGGWANVAASGAWSSAPSKPVQTSSVSHAEKSRSTPSGALSSSSTQALRMKQQAQVAAQKKAMARNHGTTAIQRSNSSAVENFGEDGKMSQAMETWCKEQLQKLNGSDDLTLVSFCMTLNDSNEIRQYLSIYLGTSDAVNKFAADFLARKNGRSQETEWESTVPKKGRKKKSNNSH